jgi:adenosine deaminase
MGVVDHLDAARAVPKALLHDHLDGGLRVATVMELADSIGWTLPRADADELQAWFTAGAATKDLLQYLATFEHTLAVMQTEEHIERVAYECAIDLAADGVVYAEVRFAPELHQQQAMPLHAVVRAVTDGFRRGERDAAAADRPIRVFAILCAMRTEQRSLEIAQLVDTLRTDDDKVVAFDLAGAETGWPPSLHAEALAFARRRHLNVTIHASEPPDLELIDDALVHGAHRIGHGVRLQRDIEWAPDGTPSHIGPLARAVLDRRVHLEMAPTCHVQVGAVPSFEEHPVAKMLRAGFSVGLNTDNRLMSDVSPSSELAATSVAFDLSWGEAERVVTNAIEAGFAPYEVRRDVLDRLVRPWFGDATSSRSATG